MMAAMKSKDSKGRNKPKGKEKTHCSNPNCNKPEWFKRLAAKKTASASAHIAEDGKDDDENYAMLSYSTPEDPTALIVTSDFKAEAHATSADHGIILDSGASRHFSPSVHWDKAI